MPKKIKNCFYQNLTYSKLLAAHNRAKKHKTYKGEDAVSVEGFTAKKLSEESEYLNGEGAFAMLIELRENPKKALAQIAKGFKRK